MGNRLRRGWHCRPPAETVRKIADAHCHFGAIKSPKPRSRCSPPEESPASRQRRALPLLGALLSGFLAASRRSGRRDWFGSGSWLPPSATCDRHQHLGLAPVNRLSAFGLGWRSKSSFLLRSSNFNLRFQPMNQTSMVWVTFLLPNRIGSFANGLFAPVVRHDAPPLVGVP